MSVKQFILDTVEDLVTLEVATLTNKENIPLELKDKIPKKQGDFGFEIYTTTKKAVETERGKLLEAIKTKVPKNTHRDRIRETKKALREAEKQFDEVKRAIGVYDQKDIFSQIRVNLNSGELVAYSRFELEGDSISFVSSLDYVKDLIKEHKTMVAASQEARKALFDTALNAIDKVIPG